MQKIQFRWTRIKTINKNKIPIKSFKLIKKVSHYIEKKKHLFVKTQVLCQVLKKSSNFLFFWRLVTLIM